MLLGSSDDDKKQERGRCECRVRMFHARDTLYGGFAWTWHSRYKWGTVAAVPKWNSCNIL